MFAFCRDLLLAVCCAAGPLGLLANLVLMIIKIYRECRVKFKSLLAVVKSEVSILRSQPLSDLKSQLRRPPQHFNRREI